MIELVPKTMTSVTSKDEDENELRNPRRIDIDDAFRKFDFFNERSSKTEFRGHDDGEPITSQLKSSYQADPPLLVPEDKKRQVPARVRTRTRTRPAAKGKQKSGAGEESLPATNCYDPWE